MKINRIGSNGFLAVKNIEVDVHSPIVLFCGTNEAEKSSLRDGIEVKQKLLDRGCDAAKIEEIMPFLRSSL